jgi:electron transfer flavoprotein alpha subunit
MSEVLVLIEHDRGVVAEDAHRSLGFARTLAPLGIGPPITAVIIGREAGDLTAELGGNGATGVIEVHHRELTDYAPEAWGEVLAALVEARRPAAVVATGTDRGNEVMAHLAAISDLPFAANVVEVRPADHLEAGIELTRVRWGGSLLEHAELQAPVYLVTAAPHLASGEPAPGDQRDAPSGDVAVEVVHAALPDTAARTRVTDRVTLTSGAGLTSAPVVVSGGRGVGSAEGFAVLEELAGLLGGAVGCSRVATNNGWRPHRDQVGQTGKRVAPQLYIACGISGAIQHWVGMMASKHVLAINTDGEANLVGKADYTVIGDLHEILPAMIAEIRRRRS